MTVLTDSSLACRPRFATPRTSRPTLGPRVADVGAQIIGAPMMPWQRQVLDTAMELDADGRPAYRRVVLTVPRQSGKTTLQLGLFVHRALAWGSPQVMVYAAQTGKDARKKLIDPPNGQIPMLLRSPFRSLFRPRFTNGHEAILWRNGSRHTVAANTEKSGHGDTLDLGLIDEAFSQIDARLEQAMSPAMATRPDAQLWIVSTAGNEASTYLRSKVDAGRVNFGDTDSGVAYFEWSADEDVDIDDAREWYRWMPALGRTTTETFIRSELVSMRSEGNEDEWRRAYGNQWRAAGAGGAIDMRRWAASVDPGARLVDPVALAVDVTPDRSLSSLAAAGVGSDGRWHVELIKNAPGTDWLVERTAAVAARHQVVGVGLDPSSAAGSLVGDFVRAGIDPVLAKPRDMASACGRLFDVVTEDKLRHRGQSEVQDALVGARKRPLADAWAWDRKFTSVDLSPLVALTLALWVRMEVPAYDPLANFMPNV
mgnify:CR=1 FL=1